MQPPNIKGGGRTEMPWSSYDPERPNREDYQALRMPSHALDACLEGELLDVEQSK